MGKLTAKQELFCLEYIKDLNGSQAAIRAGYSEKCASVIGSENLAKPYLAARIQELAKDRSEKTKVDAEYVLRRLHEIDQLDIMDIMKDDLSDFLPLTNWPKSWRISISALDLSTIKAGKGDSDIESIVKKVKWPDKTKNLELIGKHVSVGAFNADKDESETGESLNISFNVSEPVKDVRVTRGS